ncbi:MAG: hypothetical protein PHO10_08295 [Gemmiger sp.]|nr:hypothetical protein [Gemmiger sp.]
MLNKLLKHDFKATGQVLLPLYGGVSILVLLYIFGWRMVEHLQASALLAGIPRWLAAVGGLFGFLSVLGVLALFICCMVVNILRFYRLLGDEGYLMFTLPVTAAQQLASKLIVAVSWTVGGILLVFLYGFAMAVPLPGSAPMEVYPVPGITTLQLAGALALAALVALAGIACGFLFVYLCCAVGGQWPQHRLVASVASFFIIQFVLQVALMVVMGVAAFGEVTTGWLSGISLNVYNLFNNSLAAVIYAMLGCILLIMVVFGGIVWAVTNHFLSKKLNLA